MCVGVEIICGVVLLGGWFGWFPFVGDGDAHILSHQPTFTKLVRVCKFVLYNGSESWRDPHDQIHTKMAKDNYTRYFVAFNHTIDTYT